MKSYTKKHYTWRFNFFTGLLIGILIIMIPNSCTKESALKIEDTMITDPVVSNIKTAFDTHKRTLPKANAENFRRLGREGHARTIHWNEAEILSDISGVVRYRFPITYPRQHTSIMDTTGKSHDLKKNSWLVVDSADSKHPIFRMFTLLPNGNYIAGYSQGFSGVVEITDWNGELLKAVIYDNGKIIGRTPQKGKNASNPLNLVMAVENPGSQYICIPIIGVICAGHNENDNHVCNTTQIGQRCYYTRGAIDDDGWPIIDEDIPEPEFWYYTSSGMVKALRKITINVNDNCLHSALTDILELGLNASGIIADIVKKFIDSEIFDIKVVTGLTKDDAMAQYTAGSRTMNINTGKLISLNGTITIAQNYYQDYSKEGLAALFIHELFHALIDTENYKDKVEFWPQAQQHQYIGENYIDPIANFLMNNFNLSMFDAQSLVWHGITDAPIYKMLTELEIDGVIYSKTDLTVNASQFFARIPGQDGQSEVLIKGTEQCQTTVPVPIQ